MDRYMTQESKRKKPRPKERFSSYLFYKQRKNRANYFLTFQQSYLSTRQPIDLNISLYTLDTFAEAVSVAQEAKRKAKNS